MAHYIVVPVNENGVVFDPQMNDVVTEAMAVTPFAFSDVYVYSHGWSNNAINALDEYNKFSVDFAKLLLTIRGTTPQLFAEPPRDDLGIGIHWPSQITEDSSSPLNAAQLLTFYTMEHRADAVGKNAVYTMLRLILNQRVGSQMPLRIFMIGHSFGCKVVLSALQDLQVDIGGGTVDLPADCSFNVALLEAATDNDNLELSDIYGAVSQINNLRLLLTKSDLDEALGTWYPAAGRLANLFHAAPVALGHSGPTAATCDPKAFGPPANVSVNPGFLAAGLAGIGQRLVVADLTPVHQYRIANGLWKTGGLSGSHSDISFAEVYELIGGFFYRAI